MGMQTAVVVVAVNIGPLRSSVLALLRTIPQIQIIAEAKEKTALLEEKFDITPDLILIEVGSAEDNGQEILMGIKNKWPETKLMVLVDNNSQEGTAVTAGADAVIFKGFRASKFVEAVEELLSE